jgi:hypothetical protein
LTASAIGIFRSRGVSFGLSAQNATSGSATLSRSISVEHHERRMKFDWDVMQGNKWPSLPFCEQTGSVKASFQRKQGCCHRQNISAPAIIERTDEATLAFMAVLLKKSGLTERRVAFGHR